MVEKIELGDKVKDKFTPLKGMAVAITHYIYGCTQILIQPRELHEGVPVDAIWIDAPQLELVKKKRKEIKKMPKVPPHGGIRSHPKQRQ